MAYNKVEANGETLIDLTGDTVTADTLVSGRTAHLASGERIIGTFEPVTGVKGNAESTYRKGDVNLTAANIRAVDKNGDTMTGSLVISGAQVRPKSTNIDRDGELPSSTTTGNGYVRFLDNSDEGIGMIRMQWATDGRMNTQLYALNENSSGSQVDNYISVEVDKTGVRSYMVADPAAFRSAIGLGNVNNTSDASKPISTATQAALDDISGELDCLTIKATLVNNEVVIQNTSDFTSELYSKYYSYTKPKFAILELQITSNTYYYKALLNSSFDGQWNFMEASFITVSDAYMNIYNFTWLKAFTTVGTPTVIRKALNLGS